MSGRGGQGRGRGGRGGRGSRCRVRGSGHYTATLNKNNSLCSALGNKNFNYNQKRAADQMRETWENIVHRVGTIYIHDISNGLQNKIKVFIQKTEYTEAVPSKQKHRVGLINLHISGLSEARAAKRVILTQAVEDGNGPESSIKVQQISKLKS